MWSYLLLISTFGCSTVLSTSFYLGGVISGNRMAGIPLGLSLGDGEVDVEGVCTESGMVCQNCTHAVTCIPLPIGWLKVPLQDCSKDQTCNAHKGGCSTDPTPECDPVSQSYQHTCEQVGIFPDAYDCRKFHLCSPPEGIPSGSPADHRVGLCPRNYGYNPSTAQCSVKLRKGQCTVKPVPNCKEIGDYGVLPSSPNHYYVCLSKNKTLYPQVFICPHGWFFWGGFCRPEPEVFDETLAQQTTTIKPTTTTTTPTTTTPTPEPTTTERYKIFETMFATDKPTTMKADTFLADKYGVDLENYDVPSVPEEWASDDDVMANSWEST